LDFRHIVVLSVHLNIVVLSVHLNIVVLSVHLKKQIELDFCDIVVLSAHFQTLATLEAGTKKTRPRDTHLAHNVSILYEHAHACTQM